jgi:flagellar hook-length control protein FliK
MLQLVNAAAPAPPRDRPRAGASRRPDTGDGKASDPFAALVDESVRSTAERNDPSAAGRPSAKPSRAEADEPAADVGTARDVPVETVAAMAAPVWVAPPVDSVPDAGGMTFEIVAADPAVTSIADTAGEAVATPPPTSAAGTGATSVPAAGAGAYGEGAAESAPVPVLAERAGGQKAVAAAPPSRESTTIAKPGVDRDAVREAAATGAEALAAGLEQYDTTQADTRPAPKAVAAEPAVAARAVDHETAVDGRAVQAPEAGATAGVQQDVTGADVGDAAPMVGEPQAAPAKSESTGTARRAAAPAPREAPHASHSGHAGPVETAIQDPSVEVPTQDSAADSAPSQTPRWTTRLGAQLQRALKTTGDTTSAPQGDPVAASAATSVSAAVTAAASSAFSGGTGDRTTGDGAAGARAAGAGMPTPVAPAAPPADFARYLGTAQAADTRPSTQALDEVAPQLVQAMRLQATQGGGEARVHLRPEHLGAVTIDVRVEHGRVSASFNADVPAVRQWLESHEASLRQGLSDQGLQLERFVVHKDGDSPQRDAQGREDARRRQTRRNRPDEEHVTFEVIV